MNSVASSVAGVGAPRLLAYTGRVDLSTLRSDYLLSDHLMRNPSGPSVKTFVPIRLSVCRGRDESRVAIYLNRHATPVNRSERRDDITRFLRGSMKEARDWNLCPWLLQLLLRCNLFIALFIPSHTAGDCQSTCRADARVPQNLPKRRFHVRHS